MSNQPHTYQFQDPNPPEDICALLLSLVLDTLRFSQEARL